jgi:hypothetical protein
MTYALSHVAQCLNDGDRLVRSFFGRIVECRAPVVVARVGSTGRIIMALSTISLVENVAGQESREKPDFDPFVDLWFVLFLAVVGAVLWFLSR